MREATDAIERGAPCAGLGWAGEGKGGSTRKKGGWERGLWGGGAEPALAGSGGVSAQPRSPQFTTLLEEAL